MKKRNRHRLKADYNPTDPLAPKKPHYAPKAKNVIFLYMDGGPSHVDTFDYKPLLKKFNGQDPRQAIGKLEPTQFDNIGKVMQSPWAFKQHGESGAWVSDLFPNIAKVADDLTFIKSMTSKFPEHTAANYFLHTGSGLQGRPSMGAWVGYGLALVLDLAFHLVNFGWMVKGDHSKPFLLLALFYWSTSSWSKVILVSSLVPIGLDFGFFTSLGLGLGLGIGGLGLGLGLDNNSLLVGQ